MKIPTDADIAAALDRKGNSEKISILWNFICASGVGFGALNLNTCTGFGGSAPASAIVSAASIGALWAGAVALERASAMWQQSSQDVPQNFLDELREKASEISAHRNAKGLWIVCDPTEENLRVMTPAEFKQYEKLVAAQGRWLDKLQVSGDKLTYTRYVGGKLHAPENEPAMVTIDLKTGKGDGKFFTNGVKVFVETKDMKLPFGAKTAPSSRADPHDFDDGNGPVPAHRHRNPDGSIGGWVANTAYVAPTAWVGENARVFGDSVIFDKARVSGEAQIFGNARVSGEARVSGDAQIFGKARVSGEAQVYGKAVIYGEAVVNDTAVVNGDAHVCGNAQVSGEARVCGNAVLTSGDWSEGVIDTTPNSDGPSSSGPRM